MLNTLFFAGWNDGYWYVCVSVFPCLQTSGMLSCERARGNVLQVPSPGGRIGGVSELDAPGCDGSFKCMRGVCENCAHKSGLHHPGRCETQHCDVLCLPDQSLLITILFHPDHHIDIYTLHRKPCRIRAIVKMLANVQLVCPGHSEDWALHCLRAATFRTDG